jgi:hypothetical protein
MIERPEIARQLRQFFLKSLGSLAVAPLPQQCDSERELQSRQFGIELGCRGERFDGRFALVKPRERRSEIGVSASVFRLQFQKGAPRSDGFIPLALPLKLDRAVERLFSRWLLRRLKCGGSRRRQ